MTEGIIIIMLPVPLQCVKKERFVWLTASQSLKEGWSTVTARHGEQCVIMDGLFMNHLLSAYNLGLLMTTVS